MRHFVIFFSELSGCQIFTFFFSLSFALVILVSFMAIISLKDISEVTLLELQSARNRFFEYWYKYIYIFLNKNTHYRMTCVLSQHLVKNSVVLARLCDNSIINSNWKTHSPAITTSRTTSFPFIPLESHNLAVVNDSTLCLPVRGHSEAHASRRFANLFVRTAP